MFKRTQIVSGAALAAVAVAASMALAQGPGHRRGGPQGSPVERLMSFDKNGDGKLTRAEVTDERLIRLFERADVNRDGAVTREELETLFSREQRPGGPGAPPGFPGEPGGPGGFGPPPGGPGGPGFGGPPPPGQILPPFLQEMLGLTDQQKQQVRKLQEEVDARLDKILTAEQKQRLRAMRPGGARGPGGPPPGRGHRNPE